MMLLQRLCVIGIPMILIYALYRKKIPRIYTKKDEAALTFLEHLQLFRTVELRERAPEHTSSIVPPFFIS
jgi:hypothetical protein